MNIVDCDSKPTATTQRSDQITSEFFATKECKEGGVSRGIWVFYLTIRHSTKHYFLKSLKSI